MAMGLRNTKSSEFDADTVKIHSNQEAKKMLLKLNNFNSYSYYNTGSDRESSSWFQQISP